MYFRDDCLLTSKVSFSLFIIIYSVFVETRRIFQLLEESFAYLRLRAFEFSFNRCSCLKCCSYFKSPRSLAKDSYYLGAKFKMYVYIHSTADRLRCGVNVCKYIRSTQRVNSVRKCQSGLKRWSLKQKIKVYEESRNFKKEKGRIKN